MHDPDPLQSVKEWGKLPQGFTFTRLHFGNFTECNTALTNSNVMVSSYPVMSVPAAVTDFPVSFIAFTRDVVFSSG
jgi:hypothetical protein